MFDVMDIKEAYTILDNHNKWRKGAKHGQAHPTKLGMAIDTILLFIRENTND